MLLHLTDLNLDGELPQEVKNLKPWWYVLIVLLVVTMLVRIIGMDLAGALLTLLMLGFAVIIVRDDMAELEKYNLVFGLLCALNFFFDILPLLSMLSGRRREEIRPTQSVTVDGGGYEKEQTFSVTVKTYPFFDRDQGIVYNAESLSMILSAVSMLAGALLSFRAHDIMMREHPPMDWDADVAAGGLGPGNGIGPGGRPVEQRRPLVVGEGNGQPRGGPYGSSRSSFDYFQGEGRRLSAEEPAAASSATVAPAGAAPAPSPA